jgi:LysM repeat protein
MTKVNVARKLVLALVIVALVLPFVGTTASAAPPAASCFWYTVRWGDSLSSIAARYGDNMWNLAARNGIANPNFIRAGMCLQVCGGGGPHPAPVFHCVRWGETLWSIAQMYGTTPWAIASLNGIFNLNQIYAGQTLRIR